MGGIYPFGGTPSGVHPQGNRRLGGQGVERLPLHPARQGAERHQRRRPAAPNAVLFITDGMPNGDRRRRLLPRRLRQVPARPRLHLRRRAERPGHPPDPGGQGVRGRLLRDAVQRPRRQEHQQHRPGRRHQGRLLRHPGPGPVPGPDLGHLRLGGGQLRHLSRDGGRQPGQAARRHRRHHHRARLAGGLSQLEGPPHLLRRQRGHARWSSGTPPAGSARTTPRRPTPR